nr:hypothetical protein [Tanacetum cinerariifolium]
MEFAQIAFMEMGSQSVVVYVKARGRGSYETFQYQPKDQNIDSSSFDQIQTPQYPEMSEEVLQAKGNLMKSIQTFLEKFNRIPFGEMPKVLLQAWEKFFAIQHAQPNDTNELFQKLLEDLQIINEELAEYINSSSWNRSTFYNNDEEHYVQYKEYLENSSNAIAASNFNQEKENPPQDSDIRQLIRKECCIKACEEQKQIMKYTMLELLEVCRQKEFYCMHNNVDDLIESALNSKLLSINLRSQRLDKKKQEAKNIVEQPTKHGTHISGSLQNFRAIHKKSSISLNNTSQISLVNAITPVLPIEEPEYSFSMGYEHLSTTPETESDEVNKSSVEKLVPIPSEYEVTSDNKNECDVPVCEDSPTFDDHSEILSDSNNDDISSDDDALRTSNVVLREKLLSINRLISDIESLNDNPTSDRVLKSSSLFPNFDNSVNSLSYSDNSLPEFETFSDHTEETRSEVDLFLASDNSIPPGIENFDYDSEGDIYFLKELLSNDSISLLENESSNFDHHDDPSFPRPPPEPPDVEVFFDFEPNSGEVISAVINNIDELNEDECFDPGGEIDVVKPT